MPTWRVLPLDATHREPAIETFYHGLYNQGDPLPDRAVLNRPIIRPYLVDFPGPGDIGFVALQEATSEFAGVAYCRFFRPDFRGIGYYQEEIPELSIGVMPAFRGQGCGTSLLSALLANTDRRGLDVSLNCHPKNPAYRLYERFGFATIASRPMGHLMLRRAMTQKAGPGGSGKGVKTAVRPFQDQDERAVIGVWHRSGQKAYTFLATWQSLTIGRAGEIFREIIRPQCRIWVGTRDEEVVGFLAMTGSCIDRMYVDPAEWRNGWGTRFVSFAKTVCPDGLELRTHQQNHPARRLYEKCNFRPVRFGVSPPPENAADVEYHWRPDYDFEEND